MGHDIVPTGRHLLNTADIYVLAADLAQRLHANIKYGYVDSFDYNELLQEVDPTFKEIELGEIVTESSVNNYWLEDENYQLKILYQQHGKSLLAILAANGYKDIIQQLSEERFGQCYNLNDPSQDTGYCYIYNDTINCKFFYYARWWLFCKTFTTENDFDEDFKSIEQYRMQLKLLLEKLGGHEIIFLDDQDKLAYLTTDDYLWEDFVKALQTVPADKVLNIPEFMQLKIPRQANDYPLAFYDNFADLE